LRPVITVKSQLAAARSLLDLATSLGAVCLEDGRRVANLLQDPAVRPVSDKLEQTVARVPPACWTSPSPATGYMHVLEHSDLDDQVEFAEAHNPVGQLAFLRGMCRKALPRFYLDAEAEVVLDRGTPVPFATRPIKAIFGQVTPYRPTLSRGHLLDPLAFGLFDHAAGARIRTVLDFGHRKRLDDLTWRRDKRLPQIATLHPFLGAGAIHVTAVNPDWFFGVRPRLWDPDWVLDRLHDLRKATIAILPELSLPAVDALEGALAAAPDRYPPIVVAGSAHDRHPDPDRPRIEIRANESRVYLDGELVLTHRKAHPFHAPAIPGGPPGTLPEGLTGEAKTLTVLSGKHTRLAVVICADLNDQDIPRLLEMAGVNLLLVPSLTKSEGAFVGGIGDIASRCQGVAVVVNAAGDAGPGGVLPFLTMAAVPRPAASQQIAEYPDPPRAPRPRTLGLFDPNVPFRHAMLWVR
jgi:hypothetical protein